MGQDNEVEQLISAMAQQLSQLIAPLPADDVVMIGIHTGGVWIAERLHSMLHLSQPLGELDISFYRDDFSRIGMNPQVKPSKLPVSVEDKHIILVDDILHTGRTIRAAMNELFDYGRPASIKLVILGERDGRELPIQADVVGKKISLDEHEHVKLTGPEELKLVVSTVVK
jgi:pyrimidine operon attenuation protein/uracil phosphoribosyltransferase